MASNATYTASGNYVQTVTDSAGNVVTYSYDETKGNLSSVTDPKNSIAAYTYDANTDALTGVSKTVEGSVVSNDYSYLHDRLRTITHNGFSYTFSYDVLGNPTTVSAGTQNLITNSYESRTGKLLESTYGNGHKVAKDYDNLDRAAAYKVWNSATGQYEVKFRYGYDASGNIGYKEDLGSGTSYRYVYDLAERLVKITGTDGSSLTNGFDVNNNVSSITEKGNGTSFTTGYEYDKDNRPLKVTLQNGATGTNTYDSLGRVSLSRVTIGAAIFDVSYTYLAGVNGSTTARVGSITNSNGNAIAYTYDQNGNIETITEGVQLTKYSYNELNEVIREDNGDLSKSITYTYDAGGNILSKKEYAYTTGVLGTVISTIPYTYGDANWKDKLTAYNGKAISYDAIGNPLSYDGWTYTWENGRQLKSLVSGTQNLSFKYDDAGIRTEKTVNGVTTKYTLFGDKVSFETTGSDKIHYSYDASGNLFSMNLNGTEYYYTRNAQGDITGLIDGAKNQVVSYTYDTWGKLISTTGSLAGTLGLKNPYRYRGYRYDTESGLYYLQSRYYNPDWGRFVNADDITNSEAGTLLSPNLFTYCVNNPVNMIDPDGDIGIFITSKILYLIPVFGQALIVTTILVVGTVAVVHVGYKISTLMKEKIKTIEKAQAITKRKTIKTINLYRAMDYVEYNRLIKYGRFSPNAKDKPWIMDTKWFATNVADANTWGKKLNPYGYKIVQITIQKTALSGMYHNQYLDGIGPAYNATVPFINSVMLGFRTVK